MRCYILTKSFFVGIKKVHSFGFAKERFIFAVYVFYFFHSSISCIFSFVMLIFPMTGTI